MAVVQPIMLLQVARGVVRSRLEDPHLSDTELVLQVAVAGRRLSAAGRGADDCGCGGDRLAYQEATVVLAVAAIRLAEEGTFLAGQGEE